MTDPFSLAWENINLADYIRILLSPRRLQQLRSAMSRSIAKGSSVLDAGCGPFGILATLAAKAGASRVVGVDLNPLELAVEIATENGVARLIEFVQSDLRRLDQGPIGKEKFDVLLALLYTNHPCLDEQQIRLVFELRDKFLKPGGRCIPNRVRFRATPYYWPAQDVLNRSAELEAYLTDAEGFFEIKLRTAKAMLQHLRFDPFARPGPSWAHCWPTHLGLLDLDGMGRLPKEGAYALGPGELVMGVDYTEPKHQGYPPSVELTMARSGTLTTVVWAQELVWDEMLIHTLESVSWISKPSWIDSGSTVRVALDERWKKTNILTLE